MKTLIARAQKVFAQARATRSPRAESAELQQRFASVPAITVPTVTLDGFRHGGAFATNAEGLHSAASAWLTDWSATSSAYWGIRRVSGTG
jgi:hypothetical protein